MSGVRVEPLVGPSWRWAWQSRSSLTVAVAVAEQLVQTAAEHEEDAHVVNYKPWPRIASRKSRSWTKNDQSLR